MIGLVLWMVVTLPGNSCLKRECSRGATCRLLIGRWESRERRCAPAQSSAMHVIQPGFSPALVIADGYHSSSLKNSKSFHVTTRPVPCNFGERDSSALCSAFTLYRFLR